MYNEKLEALISAALADGVLTEKEKQVLFKKAEAMGIDLDEFEMVLEGRLAKCQKEKAEKEPQPAKPNQKKKAIPQELDDLIQEYLTDGIISAKERQVLLNKAMSLGLNVDEVDLYIDAQQQKADQAVAAAMNKRRGKTCPYCGSSIPELTDKCPNCGGNITPEASKELEEIFEELEEALVNFKSGDADSISRSKAEVERYVRKAKMYYGNNPKVQRMLEEVEAESAAADEEMKKNARNKLIAKYKWFIIGAVVVVLGVGYYLYQSSKPEYSAAKTSSLMMDAIKEGDIEKAQALQDAYTSHFNQYYSDVSEAAKALENAKAKKAIEAGDYDKAFEDLSTLSMTSESCAAPYYNRICQCLDDMKTKGKSVSEMQKFIDRSIEVYDNGDYAGEWKKSNVKKRLYDYIR